MKTRLAAICAGLLLGTSGCASSVMQRPQGTFAGNGGGSWEAVLPGRAVGHQAGPWNARLDASLGATRETAISRSREPERPTWTWQRRIRVPRQSDTWIVPSTPGRAVWW